MTQQRKGILLCGGSGTRLMPLTKVVTKSLLPVYNKPAIFYPLYTLLSAGIKDILFISTKEALPQIIMLLGNGRKYGARFEYEAQEKPNGIAEAFIIGKDFLGDSPSCLILGDNLFFGSSLTKDIRDAGKDVNSATVFGFQVSDPQRYGVLGFGEDGSVESIVEKPKDPPSNYAVAGLYMYPSGVAEIAGQLKPSARGELEITDLNKVYLEAGKLKAKLQDVGNFWGDMGTFPSLNDCSNFIRNIEERMLLKIGDISEFSR